MDIHVNKVKQRLAANDVVIGAKIDLASPDLVEMAGVAGYDFVFIDCEHGAIDLETAVHMIRAADATGTTPIVRVPSHNVTDIMRLLDAGAMGIIIPNVSSAAEARAVVAAARYQTARTNGQRGACPRIRAAGHQVGDWTSFAEWSNENILVWLSIESMAGGEQLEEILEVPDFNAILLGPFDLSISMGYPGQVTHPAVLERMATMASIARRKNVEVAVALLSKDPADLAREQREWIARGCRIFNVVSDRRLIAAGLADTIKLFRGPIDRMKLDQAATRT